MSLVLEHRVRVILFGVEHRIGLLTLLQVKARTDRDQSQKMGKEFAGSVEKKVTSRSNAISGLTRTRIRDKAQIEGSHHLLKMMQGIWLDC